MRLSTLFARVPGLGALRGAPVSSELAIHPEPGAYQRQSSGVEPGTAGEALRRSRRASRAGALSPDADVVADEVIRSYKYPGDDVNPRRYALLVGLVSSSVLWWLGPCLGLFVVDPFIELSVAQAAVVTPSTQCFDFRAGEQVCDAETYSDYYFFNITNAPEWLAGTAPPAYQEVGPYTFRVREVRFDMSYDPSWSSVSYSLQQWQEFDPDKSCAGCSLSDSLVGVNRAYQQFLSSAPPPGNGNPATPDAETGVVFSMLPSVLLTLNQALTGFMAPLVAVQAAWMSITDPATIAAMTTAAVADQWRVCGPLASAAGVPGSGITTPYVSDIPMPPGSPPLPGPPELCAFIAAAASAQAGFPVTPALFPLLGLELDPGAAGAWMAAALGATTAAGPDPAATAFLLGFLTLPQPVLLGGLAMDPATAPLAAALAPLTPVHWTLLQGYLAGLVPGWGTAVLGGWLGATGGGLVLTRPVSEWLYGYVDPVMLSAAKMLYPADWQLRPWVFTPQLGLANPSRDHLREVLEAGGGGPLPGSLSWRSDQIGRYHPYVTQKTMQTGNARGTLPQEMLTLAGAPFAALPYGLLNVTGPNEGLQLTDVDDDYAKTLIYDSVLTRALESHYSGDMIRVKGLKTRRYVLTPAVLEPCNVTDLLGWAGEAGFDIADYRALTADLTALRASDPDAYWSLLASPPALADYVNATALGSLGVFFGKGEEGGQDADTPHFPGSASHAGLIPRERCAAPEAAAGTWDRSALYACPTLASLPRFVGTAPALLAATGHGAGSATPWPAAGAHPPEPDDSWFFGVDPTSGYAVTAKKAYQMSNIVSRSALLYPSLWVAPGSGADFGLPADAVLVPSFWVQMWWEPSYSDALLLRGLAIAKDVLYYVLVVSCPAVSWVVLILCALILSRSEGAKTRRRALEVLNKSAARRPRLARQEVEMVEALIRVVRGSLSVVVPEEAPLGESDEDSGGEGGTPAHPNKHAASTPGDIEQGLARKLASRGGGVPAPPAPRLFTILRTAGSASASEPEAPPGEGLIPAHQPSRPSTSGSGAGLIPAGLRRRTSSREEGRK